MWLRAVEQRVTAYYENLVVAATTNAVCVIEVGCDVLAPVAYIPRADICADFRMTERRTHCPLKGDAAYFDLVDNNGWVVAEEVHGRTSRRSISPPVSRIGSRSIQELSLSKQRRFEPPAGSCVPTLNRHGGLKWSIFQKRRRLGHFARCCQIYSS
ncbi:MAG: DUF427 domain-containing protein [Ruegeria sp.]